MSTSFSFVNDIPLNTLSNCSMTCFVYDAFSLLLPTTLSISLWHSSKSAVNESIISLMLLSSADVFSASVFIFPATTANPCPASPALAASMLALRDKRFV